LVLAVNFTVLSYFDFFSPYWLNAWVSLVFFSSFALVSGYYITRSIGKPVFTGVFMGFLVLKLLLSAIFVWGYVKVLHLNIKPAVLTMVVMYLIFKVFETLIVLKYIREGDSK